MVVQIRTIVQLGSIDARVQSLNNIVNLSIGVSNNYMGTTLTVVFSMSILKSVVVVVPNGDTAKCNNIKSINICNNQIIFIYN